MNKIWEILNIEPTRDKAAIKRAYALLARKYNPEDEPEKFQELHEAYKMALFLADNTNVSIADPEEIKEPEDLDEDGPFEHDEEDDEEENDDFDFSTVGQDYLPDNSLAEEIIEDIIAFRKANNLNSREDLKMLSHSMKESMSIRMFAMYKFLAFRTDDVTVWDSFFNEPLIKYCMDFKNFRNMVIEDMEDYPDHLEAVKKIMSEYEGVTSPNFAPDDESRSSSKREKKIVIVGSILGAYVVLLCCAVMFSTYFPNGGAVHNALGLIMLPGFLILGVILIALCVKKY